MSAWSVDGIEKILGDAPRQIVRLIKFHDGVGRMPGRRFLEVPVGDEELLFWGRTYNISQDLFENPQGVLPSPDTIVRNELAESVLQQSIGGMLESSSVISEEGQDDMDAGRVPRGGDASDAWVKVHVFNVGQGDTIVVELPGERLWLVDCFLRGENKYRFKCWMDCRFGRNARFEKIIITHLHYDHIQGVPFILDNYDIEEVLVASSLVHKTSLVRELFSRLGSRLKRVAEVFSFTLGNVVVDIIPTSALSQFSMRVIRSFDPNEHELAVVLWVDSEVVFLSGDIPGDFFSDILCYSGCLVSNCRVYYKVSHHGSRTGVSEILFDHTRPDESIISCGIRNRYKHPHSPPVGLLSGNLIVTSRSDKFVHTYCVG